MKKMLLLAVLIIAVTAMPAFASVQNIKVSGDIDSTYLVRDNFDLGDGTSSYDRDVHQSVFITQTRLRVDADLTDNVSATVALINERAWGTTDVTAGTNDIDINLAYVTLREMLYSPLTVTVGRQAFAFGNSFVIDSAGANSGTDIVDGGLNSVAEDLSKRTAQDAIRLTLDYNPLTIDLVYSKISSNIITTADPQDDDVDLYGINANYQLGDDMNTVVEAYFWAKIDQSVKNTGGDKHDTVYMPGLRASSNILDGLNVQGELAVQMGTVNDPSGTSIIDNAKREALAAQILVNYMLPFEETKKWSPVLSTSYSYASGDSNPATTHTADDARYTAWDPMYENQGGGKIFSALFPFTNCHAVGISGQVSPIEDVTASLGWTGLWLDKKDETSTLTLGSPDGTGNVQDVTTNSKLGDEVELKLAYDYTEDVQFGASYNIFRPGGYFDKSDNENASQIMVNANVNF